MMVKLYNDEYFYGEMGTPTGFKDYHIGDILEAKSKSGYETANVIVVYDYSKERYSALGLLFWDISEFEEDYEIKKIMSWEEVTDVNIDKITWADGFELIKN